jgi:bifunctional pyridoxal-dependent enzyme with beta-cystathionase and maltose regulon repressor activities
VNVSADTLLRWANVLEDLVPYVVKDADLRPVAREVREAATRAVLEEASGEAEEAGT